MPRSIWNGALSFGTVDVPVKVYSAIESKSVQFRELHEPDGSEIRHDLVDPDGKPVDRADVVKGFEVGADEYVVLSDEEIKAASAPKRKAVEIEHFVPRDQIDPDFYDRPYHLAPQEGAQEAYALLRQALERTGRAGVGRVVLRAREQLVAVLPADGMLRMHTMRFADELIDTGKLDVPSARRKLDERMVKMAGSLVETLSARFDPQRHHDTYRERVLDVVERKARGERIETEAAAAPEPSDDLVKALEASLEAAKGR